MTLYLLDQVDRRGFTAALPGQIEEELEHRWRENKAERLP